MMKSLNEVIKLKLLL